MSIEFAIVFMITVFALVLSFAYNEISVQSPYALCRYFRRLGVLDARCEEIIVQVKNDSKKK